jgi:hypothetical protein
MTDSTLLMLALILVPVALAALWVTLTIKRKIAPALVFGIITLAVTAAVVFSAVHMFHYIGWHYINYHFSQISDQAAKSIVNGKTEAFARVFQDAGRDYVGLSPRQFSSTLRNLVVELEKVSGSQPLESAPEIED